MQKCVDFESFWSHLGDKMVLNNNLKINEKPPAKKGTTFSHLGGQKGATGTPEHGSWGLEGRGKGRGGVNPSPGTGDWRGLEALCKDLHALRPEASADQKKHIKNQN